MNPRLALIAVLAAAASCAQAQESGFKLVAGSFSGAEQAGLGQDKNYGLSVFGRWPVTAKDSVELEGGFRYAPRAAATDAGGLVHSDRMRTYYLGATYRRALWFEGFFVQGGLRASRTEVQEDITDPTGAAAPARLVGPHDLSTRPTLGVGYVFDERYSLSLGAASMKAQNATGTTKSGTQIEVALAIKL